MEEQRMLSSRRGLPGSVLKWVAILTMLIDHVAYVLLFAWAQYRRAWGTGIESLNFYYLMRCVGRLGFPLFCFLLVEGFAHTRNRWKYLLRLSLFALLSELPFDIAFQKTWIEFAHQNVFFTLALGLLAVMIWELLMKGEETEASAWRGLAAIACALALGAAAWYMHTDYGAMGVALILVLYLLRERPWTRDLAAFGVLAAMLSFGSHWIELFGALSFVLFHLYNGQRGRQIKYFFYVFYPAHLLLLACLRTLLFQN